MITTKTSDYIIKMRHKHQDADAPDQDQPHPKAGNKSARMDELKINKPDECNKRPRHMC